ncbi:hypothetical protein [Longirhabdus pacifica]|uniref:hypothetical protein n=1 Tax=Longirhabdus pacifica TaxID=2305227 RepID=UPI0013E8B66C|nr:hypothetical protein [Longirhabdus pacifica]
MDSILNTSPLSDVWSVSKDKAKSLAFTAGNLNTPVGPEEHSEDEFGNKKPGKF